MSSGNVFEKGEIVIYCELAENSNMRANSNNTRRDFIKKAALATGAVIIPDIIKDLENHVWI